MRAPGATDCFVGALSFLFFFKARKAGARRLFDLETPKKRGVAVGRRARPLLTSEEWLLIPTYRVQFVIRRAPLSVVRKGAQERVRFCVLAIAPIHQQEG